MCSGGGDGPVGVFHEFEPSVTIELEPVDAVVVTSLMDNATDMLMPDQGPARRVGPGGSGWRPAAVMAGGQVPRREPQEIPSTSRTALEGTGFQIIEERQSSFLFDRSVLVTGEVPRITGYEPGLPPQQAWLNGRWEPDPFRAVTLAVPRGRQRVEREDRHRHGPDPTEPGRRPQRLRHRADHRPGLRPRARWRRHRGLRRARQGRDLQTGVSPGRVESRLTPRSCPASCPRSRAQKHGERLSGLFSDE